MPEAVRSGEAASHFFKLYSALVEPPHVKVRLVLKGFFPFICQLILRETQALVDAESNISTNTSQGIALKYLLELLLMFLKSPTGPVPPVPVASRATESRIQGSPRVTAAKSPTLPRPLSPPAAVAFTPIMRYFKKNKENITRLLDAYLSLRGIIIQVCRLLRGALSSRRW